MKKKCMVAMAALGIICVTIFLAAAVGRAGEEEWVVMEPGGQVGNYRVGDRVLDAGSTLWEYEGNFMLEVPRGQRGPGLLTVRINGNKETVYGIHPETIPNVIDGDMFKQLDPSLGVVCESTITLGSVGLRPCISGWCNYTEGDVCMRVYCGD